MTNPLNCSESEWSTRTELASLYRLAQHYGWTDIASTHISARLADDPELADRIITVNGMSKSYAMTGWRIGYAAGPTQAITGTSNLMSQITGSPSSIGQAAAIAALDGPQEPILKRSAEFQSRRDMVYEYLSRVPELVISKPAGAFYIFVDSAGAVGRKTPAGDTVPFGGFGDSGLGREKGFAALANYCETKAVTITVRA